MSSSKASGSRQFASYVPLALKTAGVVLILAALLDILILPYPYQINRQWQIGFVAQVVDRGIVPLVGIVLITLGYWVDSVSNKVTGKAILWQDLRFWAYLLASILGLFYLIAGPGHILNVRANYNEAITRIGQEATQAESELQNRLQLEVGQQRQQLERLLSSPQQVTRALESGQLPPEQADLLRQFQQNPQALDQFVERRTNELRTQLETQVRVRREQALQQASTDTLKSGLRIGLSSLLLAIGYIIVGWFGLRTLR